MIGFKHAAFVGVLLLSLTAKAVDLRYPVSAIPAGLTENVNAVVRENTSTYEIRSLTNATHTVHFVVTILNSNAKDFATMVLGYDKHSKISDFEATSYDASGKQIKKLKNYEIYDQSAISSISIYEDNRLKAAVMEYGIYPYTVEFNYTIDYKTTMFIPPCDVFPADDSNVSASVEHLKYEVIYPLGMEPRYFLRRVDAQPVKSTEKNRGKLIWEMSQLKAPKAEPAGSRQGPRILVAPNKFDYDGYSGSMVTWNDFGKWDLLLNKDRDVLPERTVAKVRELTSGLKTNEEKAKALYEYMQSRTRYVSIQIGIGGWQPFPASDVDEKGYGDCKALSNYMVALLKAAGIKAYNVDIRAGVGYPDIETTFPSQQFNHVIAAMPNGKDTLWMECTSQTMPFGYLGDFTSDRHALMVTEEGGKLVKTPVYKAEDNLQTRRAVVKVALDGNAQAQVVTTYRAEQYDWVHGLLQKGQVDQRKDLENSIAIPSFTLKDFSIKEHRSKLPAATLGINLQLPRYASASGKRLFVSPNLMNRSKQNYNPIENRQEDVITRYNYFDIDTVDFQLPEALYPEFLPQPSKLSSRFGEYEATFEFKEGTVRYIRKMKVWKGRYPKESYSELIEFYKNVGKADNVKLVFLSKT